MYNVFPGIYLLLKQKEPETTYKINLTRSKLVESCFTVKNFCDEQCGHSNEPKSEINGNRGHKTIVLSVWILRAIYLQQEVRGIVDEHHQGTHAHIICTVWERDEENGGDVVNDLLFEVLHNREKTI